MATSDPNPVLALISQNRDNATALNAVLAPRWVDDVGFRGTSGLVVSCVGTLLACVYTALHLNMLARSGPWAVFRAKMKWVAIALMAPELVLYVAAQQLIEARALIAELNTLRRERPGFSDAPEFALGYAFFVIMGGLQVDVSELLSESSRRYQACHQRLFPGDAVPRRLAISPQGLIQLAKHGHFILVPLATIEDKSKSDMMQKFLVVGQLGWMVTQCITRAAFGLPLCLLEVHTVVHAVCALFLYLFWFKKPLDINDPEVIRPGALKFIFAFMVQEQFYELQNPQMMVYPTWAARGDWAYPKTLSSKMYSPGEFTYEMTADGQHAEVEYVDGSWGEIDLRPGQALECGIGFIKREYPAESEKPHRSTEDVAATEAGAAQDNPDPDPDHDTLTIDYADQERWKATAEFLSRTHSRAAPTPFLFHPSLGPRYPHAHYHDGLTADPGNLPCGPGGGGLDMWDMVAYVRGHPLLLVLLFVLPAAYGGIHLCGWDFEFASRAERALWRGACLLIVGALPALFGVAHGAAAAERWALRRGLWGRMLGGPGFFVGARNAVWYGVLGLYALARVYIVVEAFASLRRVPIGVFWMPSWLGMVPHL